MNQVQPHVKDRLADFNRDKRVLVLSAMASVIGAISAVIAYILVSLINLITNVAFYQRLSFVSSSPVNNHLGLWAALIPVIGGLAIGLMARYGSEKIRGHGIPEALEAILIGRSKMDVKVALLKPLSSAISIGTGGPFGAEGPIIMTGGAFGSLFAQLFKLSAAERKTLLVAGAAAGMAAIFATPLAAVLLSVELLLFEWKPRSVIPVAIAATIAGVLRVPLLGAGPIFAVIPHEQPGWLLVLFACVVGIVAGIGSGILTNMVYFFEDLFLKLKGRVHWMWWPAIGGLVVGFVGLGDPRVLGVGYDLIHELLQGHLTSMSALLLLIGKAIVWSVALGSGTSGGVLAPLLMMGGALGALESHLIPVGDAGLWALISMAAVMGGTMRSPFTSIIFAIELTHDLQVLPELLIGSIAAYAVTVLMLRRSILTEKVARRGLHITREYSLDPLELVRVEEVMDREMAVIPADMKICDLSERIASHDPQLTRRHGLPIMDKSGHLVGMITRSDVMKSIELNSNPGTTVLEAGSTDLIVSYPDELLKEAVTLMLKHSIGRLPVVSREDPNTLVGLLGRSAIMAARLKIHEEENLRETTWGGSTGVSSA